MEWESGYKLKTEAGYISVQNIERKSGYPSN